MGGELTWNSDSGRERRVRRGRGGEEKGEEGRGGEERAGEEK